VGVAKSQAVPSQAKLRSVPAVNCAVYLYQESVFLLYGFAIFVFFIFILFFLGGGCFRNTMRNSNLTCLQL